jgi:hypothetical protein
MMLGVHVELSLMLDSRFSKALLRSISCVVVALVIYFYQLCGEKQRAQGTRAAPSSYST